MYMLFKYGALPRFDPSFFITQPGLYEAWIAATEVWSTGLNHQFGGHDAWKSGTIEFVLFFYLDDYQVPVSFSF